MPGMNVIKIAIVIISFKMPFYGDLSKAHGGRKRSIPSLGVLRWDWLCLLRVVGGKTCVSDALLCSIAACGILWLGPMATISMEESGSCEASSHCCYHD